MPATITEENVREMAKARISVRVHLIIYLVVNTFFFLIWLLVPDSRTDAEPFTYWPLWPHMVWGVGLAIHALVAYFVGPDVEEREVQKLRKKMA